jgi:ABC-type uncharacterized transport system auxiliary subunit
MNRLFVFLLICGSGCSLPFGVGGSPKTIYRLEMGSLKAPEGRVTKRLAIREILSSGYIDSHRVLFTRTPGQVGSYQFASWEEFPTKRLTDLLLLHLQTSEAFECVTRTTSGSVSELQFNGELLEFVHDVQARGIRAILQVELLDLGTRRIVAQRIFEMFEPVSEDNVAGAVSGYTRVVNRLVEEVAAWLALESGSTKGERTQESGEDSRKHQREESGKNEK